ncbi:MAG: hypothetical protein FWH21_08610 [Kiritimatiellaeota bacterium]|nr:hypothetical protein [Kiritimatiellota bacterium]
MIPNAGFVAPEANPDTRGVLATYPVRRKVRIGAPLFGENLGDPEVWARTAKAQDYRAVYEPCGLAMNDLPRIQGRP